jgi:ABC-type transport system involved in multi-copper enzyme maturation permease subunit
VELLNVSFGDLLWSLVVIFFMVVYFIILFQVIGDIFRRDASGMNKALWILFILVAPFLSLFIYLVINGNNMSKRQMSDMADAQQRQAEYIRSVSGGGGGGAAEEIARAKALLDSGAISQAEFDQLKAKALG